MELKAGRELDALVAEKVMGWESVGPLDDDPSDIIGVPPGMECPTVPHYSTSIEAAWKVVERLRPDFNVVLECVSYEYNCHVNPPGSSGTLNHVHARAPTVPLAICLAALKAVTRHDPA